MNYIHGLLLILILFTVYVIKAEVGDVHKYSPTCPSINNCTQFVNDIYKIEKKPPTIREAKITIRRILRALESTVFWRTSFLTALIVSLVIYAYSPLLNVDINPAFISLIIIISFCVVYYMLNFISFHYYSLHHYEIEDYLESLKPNI